MEKIYQINVTVKENDNISFAEIEEALKFTLGVEVDLVEEFES